MSQGGGRPRSFDLSVSSELEEDDGRKLGLGSSSAVTVATVRAVAVFYGLATDDLTVYKLAMLASDTVQPIGSGGDIAASAMTGWVAYTSPDRSWLRRARQRAGAFLALEHPVQADVVIGVPDSGLDAALGYARQSGIPYGMGFIKNKYIGRTFISPTQALRESEVSIKLNPIRSVVEGKRVVLIDDSIVRGTTCRRTIDLLRRAGAKEIHMRVSAPPFVSECYYGTDIDDKNKLIANHHTIAEIAEIIGVDSLGYLSLSDVVKLADHTESGFCTACFGGGYPTPIPQDSNKDRFECKISEREKQESV